jgi:hypothetical protein
MSSCGDKKQKRGFSASGYALLACSFSTIFLAGGAAAQTADPECPDLLNNASKIPDMKIKIYNDSDDDYLFAALTMGKGDIDQWMQMYFGIGQDKIADFPYPRDKAYRIYINPDKGIGPGKYLCVTLPLYTKLANSAGQRFPDDINPKVKGQFIDWWQGGTIQLFSSKSSTPPRALQEDRNIVLAKFGSKRPRPDQKEISKFPSSAVLPNCKGSASCEPLKIYEDSADLPKADPSQLLEYTLGARNAYTEPDKTKPDAVLDLRNVDFDVSYVNVAHGPAAMAPYDNDQVGYVGTPQSIDKFTEALRHFREDYPGWPEFVRTYADGSTGTPAQQFIKLASPLEVFPAFIAKNARTDLNQPAPWVWPTKVWKPIENLRTNWSKAVDSIDGCKKGVDEFCTAILDIVELMKTNYSKYITLFGGPKPVCSGVPEYIDPKNKSAFDPKSPFVLSHVYGWGPFIEAATNSDGKPTGKGCQAADNLLENSSDDYKQNNYEKYLKVKRAFDLLNYDALKYNADNKLHYVFNPWVILVHGDPNVPSDNRRKYLNIPGAYAYSVDDAVGNVQAEGQGIIIEVGGTTHLKPPLPAMPPIQITVGAETAGVKFDKYALCDPTKVKAFNPFYSTFVLNARDPQKCPVYLFDNKKPTPQMYTFTLAYPPLGPDGRTSLWTVYNDPPVWNADTAKPVKCDANTDGQPPGFSSRVWCCDYNPGKYGVKAFSQVDPQNIHGLLDHKVGTMPPQAPGTFNPKDTACTQGEPYTQ